MTVLPTIILSLLLAILLCSCGGSDSEDNNSGNAEPIANAGLNQSTVEGSVVTLDGSASSDEDGTIAAYLWQQIQGPAITINNASSNIATFTAPAVDTDTTLIFRLQITDNDGVSASDDIVITVRDDSSAALSGLDQRPDNSTCVAPQRPVDNATITLTQVFDSLPNFAFPVALLQVPNNNSRWFVVERSGRILVFENNPNVEDISTFIDIEDIVNRDFNEGGLLAMAFHPNFQNNGEVFLYYTREGSPVRNTLARFTSSDNGLTLDASSEQILLDIDPPFGNHFGGQLGFDDDGLLYLSIGDGGSSGDPRNLAQNTNNLFGTLIRINVDEGAPYSIPLDNPFAGNALCNNGDGENNQETACPEIFSWGLRNPWRWSFDRDTGDIWLADVGQNAWEEINIMQLGGNYGWRIREGAHCFNPSQNCATLGLIDPVAEIPHPEAGSITGGFVYRGQAIEDLQGIYVVGDFVTGGLWALYNNAEGIREPVVLLNAGFNISSFAEDTEGELYLLNFGGSIYRIDSAENGSSEESIASLLSATGCVDPNNPTEPAAGLIPYDIQAAFWSDGAQKQRWMALPNNTSITVDENDDWIFPAGSILMKHFALNNQLVETRLLMHHPDGIWAGYSYEWNSQQSDAVLIQGGRVSNVAGQDWIFPGSSQCLQCHTDIAGRSLGVETAQLNRDITYPSTNRTANQLTTHESIGTLSQLLTESLANSPKLTNPLDQSATLNDRARAYLHTNCSQCHRPNGTTNVNIDLRYHIPFAAMNICDVEPQAGNLNINSAQIVAPGDPARSVLLQRINRRDALAMPPLGNNIIDGEGVTLISDWISSLVACP